MGSVCCVAARDSTITIGSGSENLHRNIQCSPSWSFQWDNRGGGEGEETSITWFSDGVSRNDVSDIKYGSTYTSEEGSPFESVQSTCRKIPISEPKTGLVKSTASDRSISKNLSMDVSLEQVKESTESPTISNPSPTKQSLSLPSTSTSPLSSESHINITSLTPSRWPCLSPGHQLSRQVSDSRFTGLKSPKNYSISDERPLPFPWGNELTRASCDGSSYGWSKHAFSDLMDTSYRERQSLDSESLGYNREKITKSGISASTSIDMQTCRVCSKLSSETSYWSSQKIMGSNELSVVAVLICGHVYHAECLENLTPENNKYDPDCPVCTFGEKQTRKLSEKVLRAELDLKMRNFKRTRNRIVDSDLGGSVEAKVPKMASSSSMRSSAGKPFLSRHFSFSSKGSSRSLLENHNTKKKGLFRAKSNHD